MSIMNSFHAALDALSLERNTNLYFLNRDSQSNDSIKFLLEEATPYSPTAIYITNLNNQVPQPQIYIYDNTDNHISDDNIIKLHKELWNSAKIPLFFIFNQTEVKIFNCRKSPKNLEDLSILETINLASNAQKEIKKIKLFNAKMFDSGAFWEQDRFKNEFKFENSVYNVLLNDLEILRDELIEKKILSKRATENLLIKSILIKYLDERGVFNQESDNFWEQFDNKIKFSDLYNDGKLVIKMFDTLKKHFNGGVFDLTEDELEIKEADLSVFKEFLEANTEITPNRNRQKLLWEKYSFKDLPIELISNIYELFLNSEEIEKNGIVYTPPILVDFMINEIMPIDKPKSNYKLIDPSCGSGIFLVGAYKRLIEWWRIQNNFKKPSIAEAQKVMRDSIFGIDKESGAIEVAYFSLSLALCDTFLPEQIWDELKFEDLRENNLLAKDFFEFISNKNYLNSYDLVIGNPPFVNKKQKWTNSAKGIDKKESVPDTQLSFLFLKHSLTLLKKEAFLVMIQPSAFLYSQGTHKFRNKIFKEYKCHQIVDFSCLNTSLFKKSKKGKKGADVAVSVSFLENTEPDIAEDIILHITVRQTLLAKEKIYFDLSHYDFHWLRYKDVLEQKSIWKCDLMGGSRIRSIVSRLEKHPTLKDYLNRKEKDGWIYKSGFFEGNKKSPKEFNKNNFLTGHLTLPTSAFTEQGIDFNKIEKLQQNSFEAPRQIELFQSPLVLIKEVLGKKSIMIEYVNMPFLSFRKGINGIHAPLDDENELISLLENIKEQSKLYIFYLIVTSGRAGVSKATSLLKKDIDLFPYPKDKKDLKLSKVEQYFVDDTLDYMMDFCKGTNNSPLLKYATDTQIKEYENVYMEVLKSIYDNIKLLESYSTDLHQIIAFYFDKKPEKSLFNNKEDISDDLLISLVKNKNKSLNISRVVRLYEKNIIYMIKPRHYRFWLKSVAVRDADETFSDLLNMGY